MKYELEKLIKNKAFLLTSVFSLLIVSGIFLVGYYYSQVTYADQTNADKGYPNYYSSVSNKYSGKFNDKKVEEVLSSYMDKYQSESVDERPFDVFSWYIAEVFFPKGEDIYLKMNDAIENGKKITLDQIDIRTIQDVGFASFENPLKLGGYNTWGDLFKVTNYLFMLASLFIIFICSSVFSSESAGNVNQLLFSTKYGRGKLTFGKIIVATTVSILIFLIIQLISLGFFYYYYGISGWNGSIQTNFSMRLFDFPTEMNNLEVYLLVIGVQFIGLLSIVGITLLISSMTKSPYASLAISLGVFFLPFLLGQVFQTGIIAKILNLFPIQNYQVEEMLTIMQTDAVFFFTNFTPNVILTICIALVIKVVADLIVCLKIKYSQVK
jgi:ABC-type transport system involved in multi-copper enzyme maturation permease subunit